MREHPGADGHQPGAVRAHHPIAAHVVGRDLPATARACAAPASSNASRPRRTPHSRFTAVGRARATRLAAARTRDFVRTVLAASATPNAPAAPRAGAPRTASDDTAPISESTSRQVRNLSRPGNARWSIRRIAPRHHSIVGGIGSAAVAEDVTNRVREEDPSGDWCATPATGTARSPRRPRSRLRRRASGSRTRRCAQLRALSRRRLRGPCPSR